jgi:hypothetical protein
VRNRKLTRLNFNASPLSETVAEWLVGRRPSRTRALFVAGAAAVGMGMLVYKLLRSGDAE